MYLVGEIVDLNDRIMGWRGQYSVMMKIADTPLIKIKNLGTNSQQFVSADRLRKGRLAQFTVKSIQGKQ
jgi:hypothetical protein